MTKYRFIIFALLFVSLNFHILRNISGLYLFLPAVLYFLAFLLQLLSKSENKTKINNIILLPLLFSLVYIIVLSLIYALSGLFYNNITEVLIGASRLLLIPMIAFLVSKMLWTRSRIEKILLIFSVIAAFGSLTLPYQYINGEITWFAESSSRAGFARYSSLFGNLTAIGIVAAIGVITTLFLEKINTLIKSILLTIFIAGLALSLQKSAVANLILAIGLSLFFADREQRARIIKASVAVIIIIILGLSLLPDIRNIAYATIQNFGFYSDKLVTRDDDTLGESMLRRTTELPHHAISSYGYEYLFLGVGVIGSAGALGFPKAPNTHNSLTDSILTGGILNLIIMFWLLYIMGREIVRPAPLNPVLSKNQYACVQAIYFLVVINLPFTSGILFQPNTALLFYFFLGLAAAGCFREKQEFRLSAKRPVI